MNIIKKIKKIFPFFFLFLPSLVSAVIEIQNPLRAHSFTELLDTLLTWLIVLSVPFTTGVIIYSAFQMLTSEGEEAKLAEAKRTLTWGIIAFIIILCAKGLVLAIRSILGI